MFVTMLEFTPDDIEVPKQFIDDDKSKNTKD